MLWQGSRRVSPLSSSPELGFRCAYTYNEVGGRFRSNVIAKHEDAMDILNSRILTDARSGTRPLPCAAILIVLLVASFSPPLCAQTDQAPLPDKPAPRLHLDKRWMVLALAGQAATMADVKTTLSYSNSCAAEADPLAKWDVCLPKPAYIAVSSGMTAGLSVVCLRMRHSRQPWMRRLWWVPQAVQIALNARCALKNSRSRY